MPIITCIARDSTGGYREIKREVRSEETLLKWLRKQGFTEFEITDVDFSKEYARTNLAWIFFGVGTIVLIVFELLVIYYPKHH